MKRQIFFIISILLSFTYLSAATRGDNMLEQAKANLAKKEYTPARYYFKEALNSYVAEKNPRKAVEAGVEAARLYYRENYYKEAFEALARAESVVAEQAALDSQLGDLYYDTARERLNMYINIKNASKARENLDRMASHVGKDPARATDLLYNEAAFSYAFGNNKAGDDAINKLIAVYERQDSYEKADSSFRALIDCATVSKNARLLNRTYSRYNQWVDSMKMLHTQERLDMAAAEVVERDAKIDELNDTIGVKTGLIVSLCVVIALLVAVIVLGSVVLIRYMARGRKLKRNLDTALEHTRLKDAFIHNILAQMQPTLDTLPANHPAVAALKKFAGDVQLLSELDANVSDLYETTDVNILRFCETLAEEVKPELAADVTLTVNAPKMNVRINEEETAKVLHHLLINAARHTPEGGKITLEYKKRGARSAQFIVADTGSGIREEKRAGIFRPFNEVRDLTKGNGLGLPINAIRARRLNGTLSLDTAYNKGARFILDVHS